MLAPRGWEGERAVTLPGMALASLQGNQASCPFSLLPSCHTSSTKIGVTPSRIGSKFARAQRAGFIWSIVQIVKLRPQGKDSSWLSWAEPGEGAYCITVPKNWGICSWAAFPAQPWR